MTNFTYRFPRSTWRYAASGSKSLACSFEVQDDSAAPMYFDFKLVLLGASELDEYSWAFMGYGSDPFISKASE